MIQTATYDARLGERHFRLRYPESEAMSKVLDDVFSGREYPLVFPSKFRPSVIIDVGANVGAAAIWFHVSFPYAKIIALEPSPSLFDLLEENTAGIASIDACNVGFGNENRECDLYVGSANVAQNSLVEHSGTDGRKESVVIRKASEELDAMGVDHVSILKVDTEGCEIPILEDLTRWMDRIAAVYVEYHSEEDRREIDRLMAEHFFLIHASIHHPNLGTLVYFSKAVTEMTKKFISPPIVGGRVR